MRHKEPCNDILIRGGEAFLVDSGNGDHYVDRESHIAKLSAYDGGSVFVGIQQPMQGGDGEYEAFMDLQTILDSLTAEQREAALQAYRDAWEDEPAPGNN